jgi:hypothetical protein
LDDDHAALDQPTENDLRDGFAVGGPDFGQRLMRNSSIAPIFGLNQTMNAVGRASGCF